MKRLALLLSCLVLALVGGLVASGIATGQSASGFWMFCTGTPLSCDESQPPTTTETVTETVPGPTTTVTVTETVTVGTTTEPPPPPPPPSGNIEGGAIDAPANGVWWGAKPNSGVSDADAYEAMVQQPIQIRQYHTDFRNADGSIKPFPSSAEAECAAGRTPEFTWKQNTTNNSLDASILSRINNGTEDANIRARAAQAIAFSCDVFIAPMHEMNGSWYGYGQQPSAYRAAVARIIQIFDEEGAQNDVSFIFDPSAPQSNFADYYVDGFDWIGADGYNWGECKSESAGWTSFRDRFEDWYAWGVGKGKPMIVVENGSAEQGGSKATWIRNLVADLKSLPAIHGLIHSNYEDGVCDWRANSSASALDAYRDTLADPYFVGE